MQRSWEIKPWVFKSRQPKALIAKGQVINRSPRCQIIFQDVLQNRRLKNLALLAFGPQHSILNSPQLSEILSLEKFLTCVWDILKRGAKEIVFPREENTKLLPNTKWFARKICLQLTLYRLSRLYLRRKYIYISLFQEIILWRKYMTIRSTKI